MADERQFRTFAQEPVFRAIQVMAYCRASFADDFCLLMVAVFGVTVLYPYMVKDVPSGQVGVLWKRFGGGTVLAPGELREEGLHLILPWDHLFIYNLRLQSFTETYNAISSDGVSLSATINVRFRLSHDQVPLMHQAVGPKYLKMLVLPEIGSRAREIIADIRPKTSIPENVGTSRRKFAPFQRRRWAWKPPARSIPARRCRTA